MLYSIAYSRALHYGIEQFATPNGLPKPSAITPHDDLINKHAKRWAAFTPTVENPSPGRVLSDEECDQTSEQLGHPQEFADMAGVLAGTKPAAWVDRENVEEHPVGRSMAARLQAAGHVFSPLHNDMYFVGHPEAVNAAHQAAWSKPQKDHVGIGTALGYPKEAIEDFLKKRQQHAFV